MWEGEKEAEKDKKMESVNNENLSEREGMIVEDNETGPEDEIETENEWPEDAEVRPKSDFFSF